MCIFERGFKKLSSENAILRRFFGNVYKGLYKIVDIMSIPAQYLAPGDPEEKGREKTVVKVPVRAIKYAGVERIEIELTAVGREKETSKYQEQWKALVGKIVEKIKPTLEGLKGKEREETFFKEFQEALFALGDMGIANSEKYAGLLLFDSLEKGKYVPNVRLFDCDNASFLVSDTAKHFDIGLDLVTTQIHASASGKFFFFDTVAFQGERKLYGPIFKLAKNEILDRIPPDKIQFVTYIHLAEHYKNTPEKSLAYAQEALRIHPRSVTGLSQVGTVFYLKGDYKNAETYYTRAIKQGPHHGFLYVYRANTYRSLGKKQMQMADHETAAELRKDPKDYNNLGAAYSEIGNYKNAIKVFTKAIALDSNYALAYANRAGMYDALAEQDFGNARKYEELANKDRKTYQKLVGSR
jgi:tetratricopeptide (TPR) repeat protein